MNPNNSDALLEALRANGYLASAANIDGVPNVQVGSPQHDYYYGSESDFAKDKRTYMRDPRVSVAVLAFETSEASSLSTRFIGELLKLVAPADRLLRKHVRPLVRTTATTLHAVYQTNMHRVELRNATPSGRQLFEHGLRIADAGPYSHATLKATCAGVLLNGGVWLNDATPLTVKHAELPTWNRDEMSAKLREFVDRFTGVSECERYLEPPPHADMSAEAQLARQGVTIVPETDDAPPPVEYADERLRAAFGVPLGVESVSKGFAARRRG